MSRINTRLRSQKKVTILEVASELLNDYSYLDITLDLISGKLGMTKSNLYHYFESKEQLYQDVFLQAIDETMIILDQQLYELKGCDDIDAVVRVLVGVSSNNKGINEVGSLLSSTLTRNISDETATRFQEHFNYASLKLTKALLTALPTLDVFQVERFIWFFLSFKNGLWADVNANEKYKEIMRTTPIGKPDDSFEDKLSDGLSLLLRGLFAEKSAN